MEQERWNDPPLNEEWPPFRLGETLAREVVLDAASIRAFAAMTGDTNPLHHDEAAARQSRFGRLIASGSQTASLLASMTAALVTERCAGLGLEVLYRFRKAVLADEPLRAELELVDMLAKPHRPDIVLTFAGRLIKLETGEVAVDGHTKSMIFREARR